VKRPGSPELSGRRAMVLVGEPRLHIEIQSQSRCAVTARGYKGRPPTSRRGNAFKQSHPLAGVLIPKQCFGPASEMKAYLYEFLVKTFVKRFKNRELDEDWSIVVSRNRSISRKKLFPLPVSQWISQFFGIVIRQIVHLPNIIWRSLLSTCSAQKRHLIQYD